MARSTDLTPVADFCARILKATINKQPLRLDLYIGPCHATYGLDAHIRAEAAGQGTIVAAMVIGHEPAVFAVSDEHDLKVVMTELIPQYLSEIAEEADVIGRDHYT